MKLFLLAVCLLSAPLYAGDSSLAGTWLKDGAPYAQLRPDGTGTVDGSGVAWKSDGKTLTLMSEDGDFDRLPYKIEGDKLKIAVEGVPSVLTRAGSKTKATTSSMGKGGGGKDDLSALLTSSPWCHFRYNKISGATNQERVIFRANGTWGSGARSESYSSGANGSVAGQTDSGAGGRWKAQSGRLLMSEGGGALEDANLSITKNSNGYPILNADGKEYSQCR